MESCLGVLERDLAPVAPVVAVYWINVLSYWSITHALALIRNKVEDGVFQTIWVDCMTKVMLTGSNETIGRRVTVAATFIGGLELVRQGEISVEQVSFSEMVLQLDV
ncbi:hypothetical protein [Novacetimonas pomaceti]|uniref:hypothetical protein n=1 Tax=Novacetimonas pomaceti TaxID=2021998 RepID=UPI001C2CFE9F|nr:hypothetical protein [Novacetimonas pomaceti]